MFSRFSFTLVCLVFINTAPTTLGQIQRRIPPVGIEIAEETLEKTNVRLASLRGELQKLGKHPNSADVDVLLKAVEYAMTHREIYSPKQMPLLKETLDLADQRLKSLQQTGPNWDRDHLTLRGFYSRIDDSPQPYGLVIPKNLPQDRPSPLYVWLHGRGDKTTDIHFIKQRLTKVGYVAPPNAIVLHPFGRQCLGYKSAGETDVFEAIEHVKANYMIDPDRIVLMGFSMGGAGAWHLGAHYADQFVAVSPGAGFAETAKYQRLSENQIAAVPWYERTLWNIYDCPNYAANFFNIPTVVCYSGENDKQIQAARVMEEAFRSHGKTLDHIIGPGMGHKYDETSLKTILAKVAQAVDSGLPFFPQRLILQTRTLKYSRMHWVQIDRLEEHWKDSRVEAQVDNDTISLSTKNVRQLSLTPARKIKKVVIDGEVLSLTTSADSIVLSRSKKWKRGSLNQKGPTKKPGLQGPIDDAFTNRFVVVTPDTEIAGSNQKFDEWVDFELEHLRARWASLFRGKLPEKPADQVEPNDIQSANLILFGTRANNSVMKTVMERFDVEFLKKLRTQVSRVDAVDSTFASWIYPNPLNPEKYVVFNSGPTFREAHDRTNSLQNPKLPDWVVHDLSAPPNSERAANVVDAGFFDETWQFED